MSIPLDRLYNFIESIALEIPLERDVIIYRFWPHGSKKIQDLLPLHPEQNQWLRRLSSPHLYCHDQEPLDYDAHESTKRPGPSFAGGDLLEKYQVDMPSTNLRIYPENIYDQCLLLHSEQRSYNLGRYEQNGFIPVYYWSHALIARDWFRYAEHVTQQKSPNTQLFFAYNRAWAGTREYRLKFADLLVEHDLLPHCAMSLNAIDPGVGTHYLDNDYHNRDWLPVHDLERYFQPSKASSDYSADFDIEDYQSADIEIVLETLFDDDRLHLTEKSLRPMALAQPFLMCGTPGSLAYLRSYGFETFGSIIDETYDTIMDARQRLTAVVACMQEISRWTPEERTQKVQAMRVIAERNRQRFFSGSFQDQVIEELRQNLHDAMRRLESTNTCRRWFERRRYLAGFDEINQHQLSAHAWRTRKDIADLVLIARKYRK